MKWEGILDVVNRLPWVSQKASPRWRGVLKYESFVRVVLFMANVIEPGCFVVGPGQETY